MDSKKLVYLTVSDKGYSGFLRQLCKSHKRFSKIPLICLTVNYEPDIEYDGFSYLSIHDEDIAKYDLGSEDSRIKTFPERIERLVSLKCKMLSIATSLGYDHFMFIDADCILNRNSDGFFNKMVGIKGETKFPISTYFRSQWSTTHINPMRGTGNLYIDESERRFSYLPLHNFYGTRFNEIWYKTTFCVYFNKDCKWFFDEANSIIFDPSIPKDSYKYTIPQEDETVFNYLYSKYNFNDGISFIYTTDMFYNVPIERVRKNQKMSLISGISSLYHIKYHSAKNYDLYDDNERNMVDELPYDSLLDELDTNSIHAGESIPSFFSLHYSEDLDGKTKMEFLCNISGSFEIICCSSQDPSFMERFYLENVSPGCFYYIIHPTRDLMGFKAYFFDENLGLSGIISY